MSTLAAARADNFYYPPGWTPDKGGLNKFQGSHGALGARAKKLHLGILVIRFEMPYNCWCLGCGTHIAQGVRYNAEKKKVGKYFTTPIWEFNMKCHLCDQRFLIRTDPKNADYEFVSGVRKKIEEYSAESAETVEFASEETTKKLATDPFFKLEHLEDDKRKARSELDKLRAIQAKQSRHEHDSDLNAQLRRAARHKRKAEAALLEEGRKKGYGFALLPSAPEDAEAAAQAWRHGRGAAKQRYRAVERERYRSVKDQNIFAQRHSSTRAAASRAPSTRSPSSTTRATSASATASSGARVKAEPSGSATQQPHKRQRTEGAGSPAKAAVPAEAAADELAMGRMVASPASSRSPSSPAPSCDPQPQASKKGKKKKSKVPLPGLDEYGVDSDLQGEGGDATPQAQSQAVMLAQSAEDAEDGKDSSEEAGVGRLIAPELATKLEKRAARRKQKVLSARRSSSLMTKQAKIHANKVAFLRQQRQAARALPMRQAADECLTAIVLQQEVVEKWVTLVMVEPFV